jgi:hypothetical protein
MVQAATSTGLRVGSTVVITFGRSSYWHFLKSVIILLLAISIVARL